MPFPATAIANELIDRAAESRATLTQINIQKLVYFAHGWHLAWSDKPLILDSIEAWQYGPVVRSLYSQFRRFGSDPITEKAMEFGFSSGKFVTSIPSIELTDEGVYARNVVGAVWQQYGKLAPFKLVELTHAAGSPWERAYTEGRRLIGNEEIKEYFAELSRATA